MCAAGVDEAVVLIMAMRSSNMPKFLVDDAVLFSAIVSDLFPGLDVPEQVTLPCLCQRVCTSCSKLAVTSS